MKKGSLAFLMIFAVFLFGACHKNDMINSKRETNGLVFKSTIAESNGNMQSSMAANGTEWSQSDAIGVYMTRAGQGLVSGSVYAENKKHVTENGGTNGVFIAADANMEINYPEDGSNVDFIAYYPYRATITNNQYPVDVTDQSSQAAIDLLYSNNATGHNENTKDISLIFRHQLSKLIFNISSGEISDLSGLGITVRGTKTRANYNLSVESNALVADDNSVAPIVAKVSSAGAVGEAIIIPSGGASGRSVSFTLPSGAVYNWSIPASANFEEGKRYTYNVNLQHAGSGGGGSVQMQVSAAVIEDWLDAPSESFVALPDSETPGNPTPVQETAIAFPGAEGAGKQTTGGRGGKIIKVTNLNDAGAGSLRAAIEQTGARIIVFEVSGNVALKSRLQIKNGDVTIAGQTAPGDGICIQDHEVNIAANNVIVRYMRFRLGDTYVATIESDAFWGRDLQNIVIDHCSTSWSIDETASFYHNKNFTMQWCMITESMNNSGHAKGAHGYGGIWGGSPATFHHNLIAHHTNRNPRFDGGLRYSNGSGTGVGQFGPDKIDYRNNVIYNWSGNSAYGGENGEYNIVNNYYKPGPATPSSRNKRIMQVSKDNATTAPNPAIYGAGYGTFYIDGNYVAGNPTVTANNWSGGVDYDSGITEAMVKKTVPFASTEIPVHTAAQAYEAVLSYAGASYKRDAVDTRIANEVRTGTATYTGSKSGLPGIIDTQKDVGGWPVLTSLAAPVDTDGDGMPDVWETANKLNPNVANANGKDLSTGYDNIEVYINSLVKNITDNQKQ